MLSFGEKVPVPFVVHTPVVLPPDTLPFSPTVVVDAQITVFDPALTKAAGTSVSTSESAAGLQPLDGVKVRITLPALTSAALGK